MAYKKVKNEGGFYPFTNDLMFCYVLSNNPDLAKQLIGNHTWVKS